MERKVESEGLISGDSVPIRETTIWIPSSHPKRVAACYAVSWAHALPLRSVGEARLWPDSMPRTGSSERSARRV
jgi:hypothetical protein